MIPLFPDDLLMQRRNKFQEEKRHAEGIKEKLKIELGEVTPLTTYLRPKSWKNNLQYLDH